MKRKDYEKPAMGVVKIQHTGMLMTSGLDAGRTNYGTANEGITDGINSDGEWLWN